MHTTADGNTTLVNLVSSMFFFFFWVVGGSSRDLSVLIQVQLEVEVTFIQDTLKGDDTSEIRVKFIKKLEDAVPAGDD